MKFSLSLVALVASALSVSALNTIEVKGNAFFDSETGDRFYIRGVDYQIPDANGDTADPLADYDVCSRDIPYIKALGMNTIRVYHVDNSADHSDCMQLLADNDIYLILDVANQDQSISRDYPYYSYNYILAQHNFATIDVFQNYTNLLGFIAANEVVNDVNTTKAATVLKAVIRDMRAYIKARDYRSIPVGYAAADVEENRYQLAHYLNCGEEDTRAEFFAINDYSWCGDSSYTVSGYSTKVKNFSNYSLPLFFSEYGCNLVEPRPFSEVESIYSEEMTAVFSGGLVYEYVQEANDYGLVNVTAGSDEVTILTDYNNLASMLNSTSNPSGDGGYTTDNEASECPAYVKGLWEANNTLPALPSEASAYMTDGAGDPLGPDGPSNQWTPSDSSYGDATLSVSGSVSQATATLSTSSGVSSSAVGSSASATSTDGSSSSSSSSSSSASSATSSAAESSSAAIADFNRAQSAVNFAVPAAVVVVCFGFGLVAF
ncbi:Glucanosyltransferase-domain-containing protein [Myxozyma melibiosi]|uniref:1,3-beta-glucanosyltransferase n=1 Tax=Myxozyma melibiosi TaxID=54550 RepID=A0ABR1F869_9ASCO